MKITNTRLMEIIKEEYQRVLSEKQAMHKGKEVELVAKDGPGPLSVIDPDGDGPKPAKRVPEDEVNPLEEEEIDEEIEIIE